MSEIRNPETSDRRVAGTAPAQLFERPGSGERALLVQVDDGSVDIDYAIEELRALAVSAGAEAVHETVHKRRRPDPRYFIGRGKVDEIGELLTLHDADLVLVNHALSPAQERNLERALHCRVLDRVGLILDIFAQRARSHEGKLQVELAQLRHIASRLVRGWSHLERQKGGIGLRGPGETQLEMDRRMLGVRIKQLEKKLSRVRSQREQGRQARRKQSFPTVSLVGYTNAGKSTLFNRFAEEAVFAADQLFATLDTTLRRIELPGGESAIFADTVGFIRDLPHEVVAAFRSTLEETTEADLLLHVIDAASPSRADQIHEVEAVLAEIGAAEIQVIRVYNKIDRLDATPHTERDDSGRPVGLWLSAATGEGMQALLEAVAERVGAERVHGMVDLSAAEGRLRARFFEVGEVLAEQAMEDGGWRLEVNLPRRDLERLRRHDGLRQTIRPVSEAALRASAGGL